MRLGTRWAVGAAAPDRLPEAMRAAVRSVEAELGESGQPTDGWAWTLTYLEGAPIVDLDDGTRIRMTGDDSAVVTAADLDDEDDEG